MAAHPWLDDSAAPLFQHNYPADGTVDQVVEFGRIWEKTIRDYARPYGVVADLTRLISAPAAVRKAMADTDTRMADVDQKYCVGSAIVVSSTFGRGLVTAVFWIAPPVYPYRLFASMDEGRAWVRERLGSAGGPTT